MINMTEDQIRIIQVGIDEARKAIAMHRTKWNMNSFICMSYAVGKLSGMYAMLGDSSPYSHLQQVIMDVHANYESAALMPLTSN